MYKILITSGFLGTHPLRWPYGGAVITALTRADTGLCRNFCSRASSSLSHTTCDGAGNKL